jgi:hypothetical protein
MCDDEQLQQESQLWPWINDPSEETDDTTTGFWADYYIEPNEEDE